MLPKNRRISRAEFGSVFSSSKKYNSPAFLMYLAKNNKNKSKFSFSVSKKVCKSAVDRNRLRRQGYSIISKHIKEIKEENLFIFVFKKGSSVYGFERLEQEILGLLSLSGVLI